LRFLERKSRKEIFFVFLVVDQDSNTFAYKITDFPNISISTNKYKGGTDFKPLD
jgi:hypothetical protein